MKYIRDSPFIEEKTKAQGSEAACPGALRKGMAELGLEVRCPASAPHLDSVTKGTTRSTMRLEELPQCRVSAHFLPQKLGFRWLTRLWGCSDVWLSHQKGRRTSTADPAALVLT